MDYFSYNEEDMALRGFPHVIEYSRQKFSEIAPGSLEMHYNKGIEICYVYQGSYKWLVDEKEYTLFPGDASITCPWHQHGSPEGILDLGDLTWIIVKPEYFNAQGNLTMGVASLMIPSTERLLGAELANSRQSVLYKQQKVGQIFNELSDELHTGDLGYVERVNGLIDALLIMMARGVQTQNLQDNKDAEFIILLRERLLNNLQHEWRVKELADLFEMGKTAFNDKVKLMTGYSPASYIINLRVDEAKQLLQVLDYSMTDIAFECGFYSSQHFSETFKKRVGLTPSAYRKHH